MVYMFDIIVAGLKAVQVFDDVFSPVIDFFFKKCKTLCLPELSLFLRNNNSRQPRDM